MSFVQQNRPYERHMVTNIPTLLPAGRHLSDLAVGQIGIFDAKTNLSVTAPTYQTNKAIYIAQGTPDRSAYAPGAGIPNIYRKTHIIPGKNIKALHGKKASRGRGEIVTLGYDGVDVSKTLSAKPGETFYYYIRLTGEPIYNLMPDRSRGEIIMGAVQMPCADDCTDSCGTVDCNVIVDKIIEDFNGVLIDGEIFGGKQLTGGQPARDYVKLTKLVHCDTPASLTVTQYEQYTIDVTDDGSDYSLGLVQAQYPGLGVYRLNRVGLVSTYAFVQIQSAGAPADYNQAAGTVIPNCTTCPAGATSHPASAEFTLRTEAVLSSGQLTALNTVLSALSGETSHTVTLLQLDTLTNVATYQINILPSTAAGAVASTIDTAITTAGTVSQYVVGSTTLVGVTAPYCTLAASNIAWNSPTENFCNTVQVQFTITVADSECDNTGADVLAQLQAAYATIPTDYGTATGTVALTTAGTCSNVFTLTTQSKNCVSEGCAPEDVQFPYVPAWQGQAWTQVALPEGTGNCVCGIQAESSFTTRRETACTFGYWARQVDWVHIEFSSHNPDWRSTDICTLDPIATRIQNGAQPNGDGPYVVRLEKQDRMYDGDYFYLQANLREAFDFYFEARFDTYYDMVSLEYEFDYYSNQWFGQKDHDSYLQHFWFPETQATALINALNTYAASSPINVDPIVL